MKRCIAFCLALGAAISLTACGGGDTEGGLLCEASGIRPDTVLLSVDGRDVSAQRYLYWLAYACDYIADYYDSGEGIQWGDTVSGQSLEDYAKDQALQNAALYATVETWAEDYGCTLTDEDRTAMDREWAARAAQYGGEEAYLAVLARMGLDRAEAEAISGDYYLYEHLYDLYCTEGSELAPAEHDLETFAQEQGYLTVDHIWLSTAAVDPADAEAVAACRARAEEAFSKLNGSADPAHDFAVLAATYSDETDRDQHPSGYTFTMGDGTLPAACEEAAQALEEGHLWGAGLDVTSPSAVCIPSPCDAAHIPFIIDDIERPFVLGPGIVRRHLHHPHLCGPGCEPVLRRAHRRPGGAGCLRRRGCLMGVCANFGKMTKFAEVLIKF